MKQRNLVFLAGVLLFLSGCFQHVRTEEKTPLQPTAQRNADNTQEVVAAEDERQKEFSILEAFAQKEFRGFDLTRGNVLAETSLYMRYYITYRSGELTISGIMNVPKGEGPFPVLILNHGFIDPAVYTNGRGLKREQDYLAQRGYVVIHPDYRNHADSSTIENVELNFRLGYVEDVINAINAVHNSELDFFDKEKIGMLGHSMGGGIAQTIMVTHPDLVDAFVLFAPVSSDYVDTFRKWVDRGSESAEKIKEMHGEPEENPEFWKGVSPATYFEKVTAPVMIHHGTVDESVPLEWSARTTALLQSKDKDITFHMYEGEQHEFINQWPLVMKRTVDFFEKSL